MKEEFIEFLKKNGVKRRFTAYAVDNYKAFGVKDLDGYIGFGGCEFWAAFTWSDTDEGFDFWENLNNKWEEQISE